MKNQVEHPVVFLDPGKQNLLMLNSNSSRVLQDKRVNLTSLILAAKSRRAAALIRCSRLSSQRPSMQAMLFLEPLFFEIFVMRSSSFWGYHHLKRLSSMSG